MQFTVTIGNIDDLDLLLRHRQMMWFDIHPERAQKIRDSEAVTREWMRKLILEEKYIPFIARTESGEVAGSGSVWLMDTQPRPGRTGLVTPYLLSMYTEKEYRKKGVATLIVEQAINWSREHGFTRLELHASSYGRGVYEKLGFRQSSEMRLDLA